MENLVVDYEGKFVTLDICGTDKYFLSENLTEDGTLSKVGIYLDGVLNTEVTKELVKEEPIYLKDKDGNNTETIIGARKSIKISGFERVDKLAGKEYKDWSGHLELLIPGGTITDETKNKFKDEFGNVTEVVHNNTNEETILKVANFDSKVGNKIDVVDFIKPEVRWVSADINKNANNVPTGLTYVFEITDKYFVSSKIDAGTNNPDIEVYINDELTTGKGITRTVTVQDIYDEDGVKPGINGAAVRKKVGERYTLVLSNFDSGIRDEKAFVEWSGNVRIKLKSDIATDISGNTSDSLEEMKTEDSEVENLLRYIDNIKPKYIYRYSGLSSTVDYEEKTVTVIFDLTDKYFVNSKLNEITTATAADIVSGTYTFLDGTTANAEITTDADSNSWVTLNDDSLIRVDVDREEGSSEALTKKITKIQDIDDGSGNKVGEKYKIVIGNIEQLDKKDGDKYKHYSGPINISFAAGIAEDKGNTYEDGTTVVNKSDATTITVGVKEPEGTGEEIVVDFIKPVWEKVSDSIVFTKNGSNLDGTATITLNGVDKYIDKSVFSTLTNEYITANGISKSQAQNDIKDYVTIYEGNRDITSSVDIEITGERNLFESRTLVDGSTRNFVYAKQFKFIISGFTAEENQISIQIADKTLEDKAPTEKSHGNYNDDSERYIIYNTLKASNTENDKDSSKFLGTDILRKSITKIDIKNTPIPEEAFDEEGNLTAGYYDVSAAQDKTILAKINGTEVEIVSDNKIYANTNSTYLFANVGYEANSFVLNGLERLNTINVVNMTGMFEGFEYK